MKDNRLAALERIARLKDEMARARLGTLMARQGALRDAAQALRDGALRDRAAMGAAQWDAPTARVRLAHDRWLAAQVETLETEARDMNAQLERQRALASREFARHSAVAELIAQRERNRPRH